MRLRVQFQGGEQVVSLTDFEEGVRQGRILAETPVRINPEDPWLAAREFPVFQSLMDAPELRLRRAWEARNVPWMTAILVGTCIRVHLWFCGSFWGEEIWDRGMRWWPAVSEKGESWRLLSYGFLHANFAHITMNLLFVAYAGVALENMFGSAGLLLLFASGVWVGGLFSSLLDPSSRAVGASAGDFSLLGASVVFGWRHADIIPARAKPAFGIAILLFTLQALFGSLGEEGVDWLAHLGGALMGGLMGTLLVPTALPHAQRRNRIVHGVFWALLLGSLLGLWGAAPSLLKWTALEEDGMTTVRPLWWEPGWTVFGVSGWVSPTGEATLVVETTDQEEAWVLEEAAESLQAQLREQDPQAQLLPTSAPPELSGLLLKGHYTVQGRRWQLRGWLGVRGSYRHRLLVEGTDGALVAEVYNKSLEALELPEPEDLKKAREAWQPGSVRSGLELASQERRIGNPQRSYELLKEVLVRAPGDRQVARAVLDELLLLKGGEEEAEALWSLFPEDRKVAIRVIRLLHSLGHPDRARQLLEEALQKWPEDRALRELREHHSTPIQPGD